MKDEFFATLSHELRTLLDVTLGRWAMLCTAAEDAAAVRTAASTIERNASALSLASSRICSTFPASRGGNCA